jgi:hypothetical protein
MLRWTEKNYGADADGNRGIDIEMIELEPSDFDDVQDQLIDMFGEDTSEWPNTATVIVEGESFEVDCRDYV